MCRPQATGLRPTALQTTALAVAILAATVSLPYLFPAPMAISRSYITGFSNRAALLILLVGTGIFAAFTRGRIAATERTDSTVGWRFLLLALVCTLASCLRFTGLHADTLPGAEAQYFLNRLQMLAAGLTPYRQFEFSYGPLLLYPMLWVQHILHVSSEMAFVLTWLAYWQIGVCMIWAVVRSLDFPVPSRRTLYVFLVAAQLVWAGYGGINYTPFRSYCSAFCICVTYRVWMTYRQAWLVASSAVLSVVFTICCSIDQAVGVAVGLIAFMLLLALSRDRVFTLSAVAASVLGMAGCFLFAGRMGVLEPLRLFGSGGYNYPLLPSPAILLTLFVYMVAGCALYGALRDCGFTGLLSDAEGSVAVPLAIAGCAMLPAALGRCDVLHVVGATPAFVVGIAGICTMPTVRRWWLPVAVVFLVIVPRSMDRIWHLANMQDLRDSDPALTAQGYTKRLADSQWYVSFSRLASRELPCDRRYFSPSFMPLTDEPFLPACLDTGYFLGFTNVITRDAIARKVAELQQHGSEPLLMENIPLEAQLPRQLATVQSLYYESESLWVPRVRHPPLTYAPVIEYIRQHYVQGPVAGGGRLRIWYPVAGS